MKAHTPGPWVMEEWVSDFGPTGDFYIYASGAKRKFPIASIQEPFNEKKTKANAQLIAAAPDLLAACKLFLTYHDGVHKSDVAMMLAYADAEQAIRAVVSKATGGAV